MGRALAFRGEKSDGMACLRRALESDPQHGPCLKELALLHVDLGDAELAKTYLLRAAEQLPLDADVWFHYGLQLELDDDLEGARGAYQRSIEIDWTVPGPHSKLAVVLDRLGDGEGATREAAEHQRWSEFGRRLKEALLTANADRTDPVATLAVARLYGEAGRTEPELAWLERTLRAAPDQGEALERLRIVVTENPGTPAGARAAELLVRAEEKP